jgi:hypothetical protein
MEQVDIDRIRELEQAITAIKTKYNINNQAQQAVAQQVHVSPFGPVQLKPMDLLSTSLYSDWQTWKKQYDAYAILTNLPEDKKVGWFFVQHNTLREEYDKVKSNDANVANTWADVDAKLSQFFKRKSRHCFVLLFSIICISMLNMYEYISYHIRTC